jgi:peptide/nickel transport system permease protein
MLRSMVQRCLEAAATLVVLVTVTFCVAHVTGNDAARSILGWRASAQGIRSLQHMLGTDRSLTAQYAAWWGALLHGNLGRSAITNQPVAAMIGDYAGRTLALYTLGLVSAALLAVALGLLHGAFYRGAIGRICAALEIALYVMPGFFIAALLGMVFSAWLHVLPAGDMVDARRDAPDLLDRARHLVLPAVSVMLLACPALARVFAQSVDAELSRDYVRTARARGLGYGAILFRHVMPNAARPLVTLLGLSLPVIFSGDVVVESAFNYPGLGLLLRQSAQDQDYAVLLGIVLLIGVATIVGNLAADMALARLDPRAGYV